MLTLNSLYLMLSFMILVIIMSSSTNNMNFAEAQGLPSIRLTPKAAGEVSLNTRGILISKSQFESNSTIGVYLPFKFTNLEVANTAADDHLLLLADSQRGALGKFQVRWNFTAAESDIIRQWLKSPSVKLRNNLDVMFDAAWNDKSRFGVDPAAGGWKWATASFFPYALESCPLHAMQHFLNETALTIATLPGDCANTLLPRMKRLTIDTQCIGLAVRNWLNIADLCSPDRIALLEAFYCTKKEDVRLLCDFATRWKPSGDASAEVVLTIGADGLPLNGRADQQPNASAGNNLGGSLMMMALFVFVFIIIF